jgi:hypothetical protein
VSELVNEYDEPICEEAQRKAESERECRRRHPLCIGASASTLERL